MANWAERGLMPDSSGLDKFCRAPCSRIKLNGVEGDIPTTG